MQRLISPWHFVTDWAAVQPCTGVPIRLDCSSGTVYLVFLQNSVDQTSAVVMHLLDEDPTVAMLAWHRAYDLRILVGRLCGRQALGGEAEGWNLQASGVRH